MALSKVFRIEMVGGKAAEQDVLAIKKAITEMSKAIKQAKGELAVLLSGGGDASGIVNLNKRIAELEARLKSLSAQRKSAEVDAKRAAEAEKLLADAKLKVAKADRERINSQIAQEKELDRQIALENKQTQALRRQKAAADALPGSYDRIKASLAALRPFIQSGGVGGTVAFNGKQINFDQAIAEFKQLSAAEQDFRRQFARDGLLVGEYTSGIVQAFQRLNIDDIIKGQVTGAKQQLGQLETRTKELVVAYRQAQQSGTGDLNKLEKEIHDNVVETQKLSQSILHAQTQLKGIGGVGSQITGALNRNFRDLKNNIAQFALGFVGFQAIVGGVGKVFTDTVKLDSLNAAMQVVSGSQRELAVNNEFLERTIEQLGLETISATLAFKNFYAASTQAGISADQTREIYFAAASAAANLKLSQEDTNGVLLAFSQIASKGKVQAEELRGQIGERVPGAFAIAARAIGKTQTELNKMLEKGEVIASDFLPKFAKELQRTFGGDTSKRVEGIQARINRLKNEITEKLQDNRGSLVFTINGIISAASLLIKLIPTLLVLGGLLVANWAVQNAQLLLLRAQVLGYNLAIGASYIALGILSVAQIGYNAVLFVTNGALALVTRGLALFGITLRATTGPLGVILTIVTLAVTAFAAFGRGLTTATKGVSDYARRQEALRDVTKQAAQAIAEESGELNKWYKIATNANVSLKVRQEAIQKLIDKFPEYFGNLKKETASIAELAKGYDLATAAIRKKAFAQASADLAAKAQARVNEIVAVELQLEAGLTEGKGTGSRRLTGLTEAQKEAILDGLDLAKTTIRDAGGDTISFLEQDLKLVRKRLETVREEREKVTKIYDELAAKFNEPLPDVQGPAGRTIEAIKKDLAKANDDFDTAIIGSKEHKDLKAKIEKLEEELRLAEGKEKKGPRPRADKLDASLQNAFKRIEAERDEQIAIAKKQFAELEIDEKEYLQRVLQLNNRAIDQKTDLLNKIKKKNAEEKQTQAELNLEKITNLQETNKKLFELENKQLEISLKNVTITAQQELDLKLSDPQLEETDRLKAREDFNNKLLVAQISFNQKQILLEKLYSVQSIENEQARKEAIEKINKELQEILLALPEARIKDINRAAQKQLDEQRRFIASEVNKILEDDTLSNKDKAQKLDELETTGLVSSLSVEVAELKILVAEYKKTLGDKVNADAGYLKAEADLQEKQNALSIAQQRQRDNEVFRTGSFVEKMKLALKNLGGLKGLVGDIFGIKQFKNEAEKFESVLQETLNNVKNAINTAFNAFFEAENSKIEKSKENQLAFLDREKERVLAQSQSEEERATIERQFEKKRQDAEKAAAKERQKLAIKQATIEFAVAAIKTFAQYGWPAGLVAVAGLAIAFAAQLSAIKSQQFAKGGKVEKPGIGKIRTRSNIPVQHNGDDVLATVKRGEVILNQKQQKALGGPAVFKKIGVPGFATGGVVAPQLGTSLKPPTFTTGFNSSNVNAANDLTEMKNIVSDLAQIIYASDIKPVILNPNHVTKAQAKTKRDVSVGTI